MTPWSWSPRTATIVFNDQIGRNDSSRPGPAIHAVLITDLGDLDGDGSNDILTSRATTTPTVGFSLTQVSGIDGSTIGPAAPTTQVLGRPNFTLP